MRMTKDEPPNKKKRSVNFDALIERGIEMLRERQRGSKTDATRMAVTVGLDKLVPGWRDGSPGQSKGEC
jgi:hypothetical protein